MRLTRRRDLRRARLAIDGILEVEDNPLAAGTMRLEIRRGLPWPIASPMLTTVPRVVRYAAAAAADGALVMNRR